MRIAFSHASCNYSRVVADRLNALTWRCTINTIRGFKQIKQLNLLLSMLGAFLCSWRRLGLKQKMSIQTHNFSLNTWWICCIICWCDAFSKDFPLISRISSQSLRSAGEPERVTKVISQVLWFSIKWKNGKQHRGKKVRNFAFIGSGASSLSNKTIVYLAHEIMFSAGRHQTLRKKQLLKIDQINYVSSV